MSEITIRVDSQVLEALHRHDLTLEEFFILKCLVVPQRDLMLNYTRGRNNAQKIIMLQSLVRKQLLVQEMDFYVLEENFDFEHYTVSPRGKQVCSDISRINVTVTNHKEEKVNFVGAIQTPTDKILMEDRNSEAEEFDRFVNAYLDLFPKGKNGGHKTLRSNFDDTKSKLIKFFNKYKRFTKDDVLRATESFLRKFRNDYTYCPTAEYFVLKDNSSALATECDSRKRSIDEEGIEPNSSPFEQIM